MKLRNKKTGEIIETHAIFENAFGNIRIRKKGEAVVSYPYEYNSLAELNDDWEDAPEEPKDFWFIDPEVLIACESTSPLLCDKKVAIETMKQIGNYFETKEEAEKAVEKLKAWKRLKDKGLVIKKRRHTPDMDLTTGSFLKIEGYIPSIMDNIEDLDLLFGGEE